LVVEFRSEQVIYYHYRPALSTPFFEKCAKFFPAKKRPKTLRFGAFWAGERWGGSTHEIGKLLGVQTLAVQQEPGQLTGDGQHAARLVRFDVQRQQGIVQRKAQQEPAVAVVGVQVDAHALVIVGGDGPAGLVGGVGLQFVQHLLAAGLEVLGEDVQAQLLALGGLGQIVDEGGQGVPLLLAPGQLDEQLGDQVSAVVQEVVFLQGAVAGGLDGQLAVLAGGVQTDGLVDDVAIAALEAVMDTAPLGDELGQAGGGDGVGDDGGAGMLPQQDDRQHGDDAVAVEFAAVGQHGAGAVYVGVKDNAQVGLVGFHSTGDGFHGGAVLGVGDVVGEGTVGVQELAALGVGAQRLQHLLHVEAARAVAGVHHDAEAVQGLGLAGGGADLVHQNGGVVVHELTLGHGGGGQAGDLVAGGEGQNGGDVLLLQAAVLGEELKAVAVEGQVAGGDHDGGVIGLGAGHGTHEHGGGGGHTDVGDLDALLGHGGTQPIAQGGAGQAGVTAYGHTQGVLAQPLAQPQGKAAADVPAGLLGQVDVLALDALQSYATDVAAVLQFLIIHDTFSLFHIYKCCACPYHSIDLAQRQQVERKIVGINKARGVWQRRRDVESLQNLHNHVDICSWGPAILTVRS